MAFMIRLLRRFPVQCSVTYNAGLFHGREPRSASGFSETVGHYFLYYGLV